MTNKQPLWKNPTIVAALIVAITTLAVALIQLYPERSNSPQPNAEVNIPDRPNIAGIWFGGTGRYTVTQEGNNIFWDGIGTYGNKVWHHKGKGTIEGHTITALIYEGPDSNFRGNTDGSKVEGSIAADVQTISWMGQNPQERIWRRSQ